MNGNGGGGGADSHLRVRIEDFDPLGGDEQIHLREGLRFSVGALLQGQNTEASAASQPITFYRYRLAWTRLPELVESVEIHACRESS